MKMEYKNHLQNGTENPTKGSLYHLFLKLVQINFIFSDNVYILSIYVLSFMAIFIHDFVFFRANRQEMLTKATRSDDVELKATLIDNEQKVDLHVPESPGKS